MEVELQSTIEERNRARDDASHSSLAQDDVVAQARQDRDQVMYSGQPSIGLSNYFGHKAQIRLFYPCCHWFFNLLFIKP